MVNDQVAYGVALPKENCQSDKRQRLRRSALGIVADGY